ncbi:MAG: hypothetical protein Kow00120_30230 [Anaerolineae bacterium]
MFSTLRNTVRPARLLIVATLTLALVAGVAASASALKLAPGSIQISDYTVCRNGAIVSATGTAGLDLTVGIGVLSFDGVNAIGGFAESPVAAGDFSVTRTIFYGPLAILDAQPDGASGGMELAPGTPVSILAMLADLSDGTTIIDGDGVDTTVQDCYLGGQWDNNVRGFADLNYGNSALTGGVVVETPYGSVTEWGYWNPTDGYTRFGWTWAAGDGTVIYELAADSPITLEQFMAVVADFMAGGTGSPVVQ